MSTAKRVWEHEQEYGVQERPHVAYPDRTRKQHPADVLREQFGPEEMAKREREYQAGKWGDNGAEGEI